MEESTSTNTFLEKTEEATSSPSSINDYYLREPVVDENFDEITTGPIDIADLSAIINIEEPKTLTIDVHSAQMIPTAVMFCLRDHKFTRKHILVSKNIPGWELLYSFFLSSSAEKVLLRS